jgi:hypothetical protein
MDNPICVNLSNASILFCQNVENIKQTRIWEDEEKGRMKMKEGNAGEMPMG